MKLVYTEQALFSLEESLAFIATKVSNVGEYIYIPDIFDSREDPDKVKG